MHPTAHSQEYDLFSGFSEFRVKRVVLSAVILALLSITGVLALTGFNPIVALNPASQFHAQRLLLMGLADVDTRGPVERIDYESMGENFHIGAVYEFDRTGSLVRGDASTTSATDTGAITTRRTEHGWQREDRLRFGLGTSHNSIQIAVDNTQTISQFSTRQWLVTEANPDPARPSPHIKKVSYDLLGRVEALGDAKIGHDWTGHVISYGAKFGVGKSGNQSTLQYDKDGRLLEIRTRYILDDGTQYDQLIRFTSWDKAGNWLEGTETTGDQTSSLARKIGYYVEAAPEHMP
jgi:YD repeat-containing protein